jgi:hypothetical protein
MDTHSRGNEKERGDGKTSLCVKERGAKGKNNQLKNAEQVYVWKKKSREEIVSRKIQ